jgi:hypothetical protein
MLGVAKESAVNGLWETFVARPGGVVKRGTVFGEAAALVSGGSGWTIRSDELALTLIDTARNGNHEKLLLAAELLRKGHALREKQQQAK